MKLDEFETVSRSGDEDLCLCPHCPPGKAPKLYVNRRKGVWICFRCGFRGKSETDGRAFAPIRAANALENLAQAWETLAPISDDSLPCRRARAYLTKREVDPDGPEAAEMRVLVQGRADYLCYPIRSREGELVAVQGRRLRDDSGPKYLTLKGSAKSEGVYMAGTPVLMRNGLAVVVEGIFDALAGARIRPRYLWCAVLGTSISIEQRRAVVEADALRVAVVFDPDATAKARIEARGFSSIVETLAMVPPEGKDIDELPADSPFWSKLDEFAGAGCV